MMDALLAPLLKNSCRIAIPLQNRIILKSSRSISITNKYSDEITSISDTITKSNGSPTFFEGRKSLKITNNMHSICKLKRFSTSNLQFESGNISELNVSTPSPAVDEQKRLDVAIVGAPNAGKSQLLNCILQTKLAAVSRKRHTTRNDIVGNRTIGNTQLLFVDTPGFTTDEKKLVRELKATASREIREADYVLIVVDAAKNWTDKVRRDLAILMFQCMYKTTTGEYGVVLNKIDLISPKSKLLDMALGIGTLAEELINYDYNEGDSIPKFDKNTKFAKATPKSEVEKAMNALLLPEVYMVSALKNDGVDDILKFLTKKAQKNEWVLEAHETTLLTPIQRVEEIIREKIYRAVHREVPHKVLQVNRIFKVVEKEDIDKNIKDDQSDSKKVLIIEQELVVRTPSHKMILMGKNRMTLNNIESKSKTELEEVFKCHVSLLLHVRLNKSQQDKELTNLSGIDIN